MKRRNKFVAGGAALLVAVVAGGAIGATKALTPKEESQAVLNDAANQLGVEPKELSNALKQALKNRVDAAVEDGRLTKEQAQRMKARINATEIPLFGLGHGPGFDRHHERGPFHASLATAAKYLGMTEAELGGALAQYKTLAQVARAQSKSVDGLVDAMVDEAETKLDNAVKAGRLTEAEKTEMLAGLEKRITDLVNGRFPLLHGPRFHRNEPPYYPRSAPF